MKTDKNSRAKATCGFVIVAFFVVQISVIENNQIMPYKLQTVFGIGLLIISVCILTFLVVALIKRKHIPHFVEANVFEFFIAAIVIGAVSLFLIF